MFCLFIYFVLIPVSCFVVLFSALFRLQLSVVRLNHGKISCCFAVLKPILCEGALKHRNTRELYSNNLRAVGPTTLS